VAEWVTTFVETVAYPGIFLLMILEIFLPVVQSEIVMTFAGFTASRGELDIYLAVVAGVAGSQVGSMGVFALARQASEDGVNDFLERWGRWLGFDRDRLERGQDFFRRHDRNAVLIGRLVPGLRSFIAIPAGIQGMGWFRFFLFNLVGTVFWVSVLALLGSLLGDNYDAVDEYSSYVSSALFAALGAYVVYRIVLVSKRHWVDG